MDSDALRQRIKGRLREIGETPITAAEKAGLERSFLRNFLDGTKQSFGAKHLGKVAQALRWSEEELFGIRKPRHNVVARTEHSSGVEMVPEINLRAGASYGGGIAENGVIIDQNGKPEPSAVRAEWGFPVPFLRDELGVRPNRVHILPIRGDSMADTLYDGDRAVIDLDDTDVAQGGIFAVQDDQGAIVIKQVELVRGAQHPTIRCKSRNASYEPFELVLAEPVKVIGRVACRITRL